MGQRPLYFLLYITVSQRGPHDFVYLKNVFNVYSFLFERESACASGKGAEREREREIERENPKQAPGSELSAQSLMLSSNPQTMRSWPELKSDT